MGIRSANWTSSVANDWRNRSHSTSPRSHCQSDQNLFRISDNGVLVENVTGSSARRIGLRPGDVVIMVGRKRVNSVADFKAAAAAVPKGESVMLLVRRGGNNSFIALPPGD